MWSTKHVYLNLRVCVFDAIFGIVHMSSKGKNCNPHWKRGWCLEALEAEPAPKKLKKSRQETANNVEE
jgi:hypothetical protein